MNGYFEYIGAAIGAASAVIVTLLGAAYGYGKLNQKVNSMQDNFNEFIKNNEASHQILFEEIGKITVHMGEFTKHMGAVEKFMEMTERRRNGT